MMIYAIMSGNLTCSFLKKLSSPGKSLVTHSISLIYFSTCREIKPSIYDFLLHKHNISPVVVSRVASNLTRLKNPEKCDLILSFLKESGFTKSQLEMTLKIRPTLLSANLDKTIKPKIKIFQDMGYSADVIAGLISKQAGILHFSVNGVVRRLALLKDLLGSEKLVATALSKTGGLLSSYLEKNVVPNVEFLKSCGIQMRQITMIFYHFPRVFLNNPQVMQRFVNQVDELGVDRSSKMFVYAVVVVGSMSSRVLKIKLQAFRNILGFSEDDILKAMRITPQVFNVSVDKMKKVKEVILGTGKYSMSCIVELPISLTYSIEQRYQPRFEVLRTLESKHLIKKWPSLSLVSNMTDDKFMEKFVRPYIDEIGDVYLARKESMKKRCQALSVGLKNCG